MNRPCPAEAYFNRRHLTYSYRDSENDARCCDEAIDAITIWSQSSGLKLVPWARLTQTRQKLIVVSDEIDIHVENSLEQLAQKIGVDLRIESLIADDELVSLYNKAQLVLYAPYLEPFGLVPLEAMACGTPVVAVKEGGYERV